MKTKQRFLNPKIIHLRDADIHVHYANNRGRGTDNVTLTFVRPGTERPPRTRDYSDYILQYRVCGWGGNVDIPISTIGEFGGVTGKTNDQN